MAAEPAQIDEPTTDEDPPAVATTPQQQPASDERKDGGSSRATNKALERLSDRFVDLFAEKKRQEDPTPAFICDGLYLGSVGSARNLEELERLGVTHILCVAGGLRPHFPDLFQYKTIAIEDTSSARIIGHFEPTFDYIDSCISNGGKVLVHCFAGKSRSVTITCAYLIRKEQMSLGTALRLIKSRRKVANPNPGFLIQLLRYQTKLGIRTVRGKNKGKGKRRRSEPVVSVVSPTGRALAPPDGPIKHGLSVPPSFGLDDDEDSKETMDASESPSVSPSISPLGDDRPMLFSSDSELARRSKKIYTQEEIDDLEPPPPRIAVPTAFGEFIKMGSLDSMGSSNQSLETVPSPAAASHASHTSTNSASLLKIDEHSDFDDEDSEETLQDGPGPGPGPGSDQFLNTP